MGYNPIPLIYIGRDVPKMSLEFSLEEGTFLAKLARKSIEHALKTGKPSAVPANVPKKLMQKCE